VNAPLPEQQKLDASSRQPNGAADEEPVGLTDEELAVVQAAVNGRGRGAAAPVPLPIPDEVSGSEGGGRMRQAWDQIQMAFPRLMGQPAYWRPRTMITPAERPFDPDDLPLEAERIEEERIAAERAHASMAAARGDRGDGGRGWRSVTRLLRLGD
jgi:hypothetical protein